MKSLKKSQFIGGKIKNSRKKKLIGGNKSYYSDIAKKLLGTQDKLEELVKLYYLPMDLQNNSNSSTQQKKPLEKTTSFINDIVKKTKNTARKLSGNYSIKIDDKQPKSKTNQKASIKITSNDDDIYSGIRWVDTDSKGLY